MAPTSDILRDRDVERALEGHHPGGVEELHDALVALIADGLDDVPLPAGGQTLERWRLLAAVARRDVALVKLVEGHLDAVAIIAELGSTHLLEAGQTWGTWAAEPPDAQVSAVRGTAPGSLVLTGRKAWCSGAPVLSHGLLTARGPAGERWLAAVDMRRPGVLVEPDGWQAVGMAATRSVGVSFDGASATLVGEDGDYLNRNGFWIGGAGIAACWWGGAVGVADALRNQVARAGDPPVDPHAAAHLGAVETALAGTAALLRETAAAFDSGAGDARRLAGLCRASAEATAGLVLGRVGRATGAAPLCLDNSHARRVADLTVFLRQSHAERDLAGLAVLPRPRGLGL